MQKPRAESRLLVVYCRKFSELLYCTSPYGYPYFCIHTDTYDTYGYIRIHMYPYVREISVRLISIIRLACGLKINTPAQE